VAAAVSAQGHHQAVPGVVANDGVEFEAVEGEVHALLGENGAGKSTLSNILTGLYRPDDGEIFLYGKPVTFSSPRDALDAGVGMVHQHFRLVPPFTVAENVILGDHRGEGRKFIVTCNIERRVSWASATASPSTRARVWRLSLGGSAWRSSRRSTARPGSHLDEYRGARRRRPTRCSRRARWQTRAP
jgi:simple sugar transport system ATP-binding protein